MAQLISVTISKLDGDQAELTLENGKTVLWPKDQLPDEAKEGSTLHLLSSSASAKRLLNDLLAENEEAKT